MLLYLIRNFYGGTTIRARSEAGLIKTIKTFSDKEKRRIRFFCVCLFLNKIIKQNYKIIAAYTTMTEKKARQSRIRLRNRLIREGKVSRNDGSHIHHKNGNPFDNRDSNLLISKGHVHKRQHRHHEADRNCRAAMLAMFKDLTTRKHNDRDEKRVAILKRRFKKALKSFK